MLLVAPMDKYEKELPSPERLRRRIILKHKKLPDGTDENAGVVVDLDASKEYFISHSVIFSLENSVGTYLLDGRIDGSAKFTFDSLYDQKYCFMNKEGIKSRMQGCGSENLIPDSDPQK